MFLSMIVAASFVTVSMPAETNRFKAEDDDIQVVEYPVQRVYLPTGLDSNDDAEVLIEGEFPDQCYAFDSAVAKVVDNHFYFRVYAKKYSGPCTQMVAPFLEKARLRKVLPEGVYDVVHLLNDRKIPYGKLPIHYTESKARDDFPYAQVDSSVVEVNRDTGERFLTLFGTQTNSCQQFDLERTSIRLTAPGFIEVRPVLKDLEPTAMCLQVWRKYTQRLPLPENYRAGRYAFYIRTGEGGSFQKLDEIPKTE